MVMPPTGTEESGWLDDEVDGGIGLANPWTPESYRKRDRIMLHDSKLHNKN